MVHLVLYSDLKIVFIFPPFLLFLKQHHNACWQGLRPKCRDAQGPIAPRSRCSGEPHKRSPTMLPASSPTSECVCPWSVLSHSNSRDHRAVAFLQGASTPPGLRLQYCSFQAFLLRELPQRAVPRLMSDLHHPCVVIKNTEFTRAGRLTPDLCSASAHPSNKQAIHHERISSSVDAKWPRAGLSKRGFTCFISRKMPVILACFQVSGSCFFMQVSDFYLFVYSYTYHTCSPGNLEANEAARCGAWANISMCACSW